MVKQMSVLDKFGVRYNGWLIILIGGGANICWFVPGAIETVFVGNVLFNFVNGHDVGVSWEDIIEALVIKRSS